MKKIIKIVIVFIGIMICFHNVCYADMVSTNEFMVTSFFLVPMIFVILLISLISLLILKVIGEKNNKEGKNNENIQKKINNTRKGIFLCVIILLLLIDFIDCFKNMWGAQFIITLVLIILSIIAVVFRKKEKKM